MTEGQDQHLILWTTEGKQVASIQPRISLTTEPRFSPDSNQLAFIENGYSTIKLWEFNRHQLTSFPVHLNDPAPRLYFSHDGQRLFLIQSSNSVSLFTVQGEQLAAFGSVVDLRDSLLEQMKDIDLPWYLQGNGSRVLGFPGIDADGIDGKQPGSRQTSKDGNRTARLVEGNKVLVQDSIGNVIAEYEGYAMALSADGQQIITVSARDNIPRVWNVDDLDELIQTGCRWLRIDLTMGGGTNKDRQMCNIDGRYPVT